MQPKAPLLKVQQTAAAAATCPSEPDELNPRPPLSSRSFSMFLYIPTHSSSFQVSTFLQFFPTEKLRAFFSLVDPSGNPCPLIPST